MPKSATAKVPTPQTDADLIEATIEALTGATPMGFVDRAQISAAGGRLVRQALVQGPKVAGGALRLGSELTKIALRRSEVAPEHDKRFSDQAFVDNAAYRGLAQSYLAWNRAVHRLIDDLELEPKTKLAGHFAASIVTEAVAPTNTLAGNPAAIREAVTTRGKSLRAGLRHFAHDVRKNGGMPSVVDTRPFKVGENVAATPGAVVLRTDVLELIRYAPATPKVFKRPLLIVPPEINKYYVLDIGPGRSLVEAAVNAGQQVFMISWRNPTAEHRDWSLDTYCSAIVDAIDATLDLTGQSDLNLMGVCAGGMTSTALLANMAARGDRRVNALTLLVTVLDWAVPSTVGTFTSAPGVAAAIQRSKKKGILSGSDLSKLFAWMRPNDLVWNYVVNNYLMGKNPPAFDILAWNADATNLPAALHADFLNIATTNALTKPGGVEVLGEKVDIGAVTTDAYVVGGVTDHITPWEACYATVDLLGGPTEFVLVGSGHIQTLVCPETPKAKYYTNDVRALDAASWKETATEHAGSWWGHWLKWLAPRSGSKIAAPRELGNDQRPTIEPAPGRYVFDE